MCSVNKCVSSNPEAMVRGSLLLFVRNRVDPDRYAATLPTHYFYDIDPDKLYPYQMMLDYYKLLDADDRGLAERVSIGVHIVEEMQPETDSIEATLRQLPSIYDAYIPGHAKDEGYDIRRIDSRRYQIHEHTPVPHDVVYGYLFALIDKFRTEEIQPRIQRIFCKPYAPNRGGAVYEIVW